MDKLRAFYQDTLDEVRTKVTWPTTSELMNNTTLVLVASLIFALVIGVMDFGFKNLMEFIYNTL